MLRVSSALVWIAAVTMVAVSLPAVVLGADAPVPLEVILARKVYIQKGMTYLEKKDPTGEKSYVEPCKEEISKWGRMKIVDDPKDADIVLRISSRVDPGITMVINNQIRQSGNGYTFLEAVHPFTGKTLWATSHSWARSWSTKTASSAVVKELRKRIEEQEKLAAKTN